MRTQLSRIRMRDAALFVAVAALVALVVVIAGREAGLGERAGAGVESAAGYSHLPAPEQQSGAAEPTEPLTLTLSGPEICETGRGLGGSASRIDPTTRQRYDEYLGVIDIAEVPVRWQITGGTPPYQLVIDGETRDAHQEYSGANGTASVSCALRLGDVEYIERSLGNRYRRYKGELSVESGSKSIHAVVTDSERRTAEHTIDVYVVLRGGNDILLPGETYLLEGEWFTIPKGLVGVRSGPYVESDCEVTEEIIARDPHFCENHHGLVIEGDGYHVLIWYGVDSGEETSRRIIIDAEGASGASAFRAELNDLIDQLSASVGQKPR